MDHSHARWRTPQVQAAVLSGDLGAIVRAVRQANALTLAELARRCGYAISTLSRMERGKQPLGDVAVLRSLARALRIPPELLGLADTPPRSVRTHRPIAIVGVDLAPDEEADPMRRRALLVGLTGLSGAALLGPASVPATAGPFRVLEHDLLAPPGHGIPGELPRLRPQLAVARPLFQRARSTAVATRPHRLLPAAIATRHEAGTR